MASDAALFSRFCSAACRRLCSQARKDWIGALARPRSRLALELVDGVDQGMGVARRRKAARNDGEPVGQIGEDRLGHAGPHQQEQRAKPLQAFAGAVHAAMPLGRGR